MALPAVAVGLTIADKMDAIWRECISGGQKVTIIQTRWHEDDMGRRLLYGDDGEPVSYQGVPIEWDKDQKGIGRSEAFITMDDPVKKWW